MEDLNTAIKFTFLIILVISPIILLNKLYKRDLKMLFISYLITSIAITFSLVLIMAWWSYFSIDLLLSHYGYDYNLLTETERLKNVTTENLDRVKTLKASKMGIGWPLKAILFYVFYSPYLLIAYFASYFYRRAKLSPQTNGTF